MAAPFRTRSGGRIDRARPLRFTFDGRTYEGFAGDTLASALIANGVHLVGRSFKYHRPRGLLGAGAEEPNALVGVSRGQGRFTPNLRATQVMLCDGLSATSQNRWPSLRLDLGAINGCFSPLLAAGFYYKTLMGPHFIKNNWAWKHLYEPIVRAAAGLGTPPREADPDLYARYFEHCDVLVVGAGPSGLAAAQAAGASGARVILCDEQAEPGGTLLAEKHASINGLRAGEWLARTVDSLAAMPNVQVMPRTQAFGYYAQNFVGLCESVTDSRATPPADAPRERLWQVRAKQVVLACGAVERPLVFADNDRPGIMLAEAGRTFLNRYGAKVGARVVVVTTNDRAYQAALDLREAGIAIARIADLRAEAPGPLPAAARAAGLAVTTGASPFAVRGSLRVQAIGIATSASREWIDCDTVLMSGGWTPAVHLHAQSRGEVVYDEARDMFIPGSSVQNERSAGACKGTFALAAALQEGAEAGAEAARDAGYQMVEPAPMFLTADAPVTEGGTFRDFGLAARDATKAFVDFQNDVCASDIRLAVREGMRSIEHIKRYTTTGMATDQGKTSNINASAIAARELGQSLLQVGLTTFRPPYTPVSFGSFAGAARGSLFDPIRHTPIHGWAEANGAAFEDVGLWKRAWYFPRGTENMDAAVTRECRTTRGSVGMFDASTLGKIEVVGPDAATFLERIYTNPCAKLKVGSCCYGLMLNEQGFIMDDGVIARIADDQFHVTTTTSGAQYTLYHMEDYLQTEFTDLKVWLTSTTEQWAVIAVQGPKARQIIEPFIEDIDLSPGAMPHMSVREGRICGIPTRLMRVSFTGELGFEVNVAANYARAIWEALWAAGRALDCVAYGTEAMHVMRAEKGYIIVGQDTDGTMTAADVGLGWAIGRAKGDFVGKRSLSRPDLVAPNRKQLVGLLAEDPKAPIEEGAQITASAKPAPGSHAIGHVTSAYMSPAIGHSIALAMIESGRDRVGNKVYAPVRHGAIPVTVVDAVFYDKEGARLNA
jgi:sarcosine oxidase subunit alpha